MMSEPQGLYRFLATAGIGVPNLLFVIHDVVPASWHFIADEKVSNLRHTNEVRNGLSEDSLISFSLQAATESAVLRHIICRVHNLNDEPALVETGSVSGL